MRKFEFPKDATPLDDYSGLKLPWVQVLSDLNRAEAENIFLAQKKYLHSSVSTPENWFHIEILKKIHYDMFCKVWDWAGFFRKSNTNIGIKPYLIPSYLSAFCTEVCMWSKESYSLTVLERAVRIHHRLVLIHPFENGNGRFARLVSDRYLKAYGYSHPIWPSIENSGNTRALYIQSLKSADQGDYEPLIHLMNEWMK